MAITVQETEDEIIERLMNENQLFNNENKAKQPYSLDKLINDVKFVACEVVFETKIDYVNKLQLRNTNIKALMSEKECPSWINFPEWIPLNQGEEFEASFFQGVFFPWQSSTIDCVARRVYPCLNEEVGFSSIMNFSELERRLKAKGITSVTKRSIIQGLYDERENSRGKQGKGF